MCFSATASFTTAGITGALGLVALSRVTQWREVPLAVAPLLFAAQQSIEGLLWLNLPVSPQSPASSLLTLLFLLFAEVFWPIYVPVTVLLVETDPARRRLLLPWLAVGMAVAAYLLLEIVTRAHGAHILDDHIVYVTESPFSFMVAAGYLAAIGLPLMLSSQRTLFLMGLVVLVGCAVAYTFYWTAFVSVWCFFAATASAVLVFHFHRIRTSRGHPAGA